MVTKITNNDLSEAKEGISLIDFSAVWCGPCQMLAPVLESLAEELEGKVKFYNADVDANRAIAMEYEVQNIPALVLLKDGKCVDTTVGFQPKESLKAFIEKNVTI